MICWYKTRQQFLSPNMFWTSPIEQSENPCAPSQKAQCSGPGIGRHCTKARTHPSVCLERLPHGTSGFLPSPQESLWGTTWKKTIIKPCIDSTMNSFWSELSGTLETCSSRHTKPESTISQRALNLQNVNKGAENVKLTKGFMLTDFSSEALYCIHKKKARSWPTIQIQIQHLDPPRSRST